MANHDAEPHIEHGTGHETGHGTGDGPITAEGGAPPVLSFHDGIPGFPAARRFTLFDLTEDGTFQLLTCVDDPDLSLVVTSPWLFFPDYAPDLDPSDARVLGLERPEDAAVFCTVIAEDDDGPPAELLLNLRAPFVANARSHVARQVVLDDETMPLRAAVPTGA